MNFLDEIKERASALKRTIVLPETEDSRVLEAAARIVEDGIAEIILIGDSEKILSDGNDLGVDLESCKMIDPTEATDERTDLIELFVDLRKHKGITMEDAEKMIEKPLYYGTLMVKAGLADGMVAGAASPTGDVLKPALQIIKTAEGINSVSGAFVMIVPDKSFGQDGKMIMADCAVNPEVDADTLGEIAVASADTASKIAGLDPKVAMLSFSTMGSAKHKLVERVQQATAKAKEIAPDLSIDGEMQADAALVPSVAERKAPDSKVAGQANVLVFPDLEAGNIGYKLVQRLAKAEAVGPIIQGLDKPVNDLSRGCSVDDIVNLTAITALQV
ncbi:phosphate acetyltransferase [Halanaerobiaceae bacterium Z-7014]|uniref:Phosphate acetyltransferase n=1 Tax=Halonatronomonas betaini TaxID=2778430 RepID=A0A931F6C7_9FIRM|nr:phosphate acetyltransferase [Halonatronomonas betaini]MBF8436780.1 phosphate acetyltransferase [Halonatronomonas betaini]